MDFKNWHIKFLLAALLFCVTRITYAQTPTDIIPGDPGGIYVYNLQNLSFGTFTLGKDGGSVIIDPNGLRSSTGDIVLFNLGEQHYSAVFEIEAPPGVVISVLKGQDVYLRGSNGGTALLKLGDSYPVTPFVSMIPPPGRTQINFGGTLIINESLNTVSGTYTGNFYITFNQE
jgi:hypothetical protein